MFAKDAIRPVYPVETAIGIAAAALTGGVGAAARATAGAIAKRIITSGARRASGILPNASEAEVPPEKLTDYALNPEHLSGGGDKAGVFESVLGFDRSNATELLSQIKNGVTTNPAVAGRIDEFGQRFTVDIPITGPKGSAVVRTGWIVDTGGRAPRLVTLFVK
jgi:filamentous hemagglutinin